MKTMLLIAGVAAVGLTAGVSQAATHHFRHHHGMASAGAYAEPKEPIAYTQLSAYLKASPRQRASNDWSGGLAATTGANVNASATTAAPPAADATQGSTTQPPSAEAAPAPTPPTAAPDVNATPNPPAPATPAPPASNAPATQPQQPQ